MLINVKMSTMVDILTCTRISMVIVGILTSMSMMNTTSETLKARKILIFQYFSFYEQLKELRRALRGYFSLEAK